MSHGWAFLVVVTVVLASGCSNDSGGTQSVDPNSFSISSTSYTDEGSIALKYACSAKGGSDVSPHFQWFNAPEGTSGYALIMDDEMSPCGRGEEACRHWGVFNLPAEVTSLSEGQDVSGLGQVVEGVIYSGDTGYVGPCPPEEHTYKTTVFALKASMPVLDAGAALTRSEFQSEFDVHILGSATISGVFEP